MNRRSLALFVLIIVGLAASHPTTAQQLNCHNQKECDRTILSRNLVDAGLPANPADIIDKAFCAGTGGGNVWCGTVRGFDFSGGRLVLMIDRGDQSLAVDFDFKKKAWKILSGLVPAVDWIHIAEK